MQCKAMSGLAIQAVNIGKRYRIGEGAYADYRGMHALLERVFRAPFRCLTRNMGTGGRGAAAAWSPRHYVWALREVSFEVQHGEVLGLVGHNGAGKSVLLKILSRITRPTEGSATIRGRVGSMLEAGAGFHPELTGRENIFLSGTILGMKQSEIARQFDEIVAFSGIEEYLDTPVKRYSSGMYVRLAFAVAVHIQAEIMLMDEVLATGDESFRRQCLEKMRSVAATGCAVVFVSHDMDVVRSLCSRALLLEAGRIIMDDTAERVVARYLANSDAPHRRLSF